MEQSDAVELWDLQIKALCHALETLETLSEQIKVLQYELVIPLQRLRLLLTQREHIVPTSKDHSPTVLNEERIQ